MNRAILKGIFVSFYRDARDNDYEKALNSHTDEVISLLPTEDWTNIKEQLPEEGEDVLVKYPHLLGPLTTTASFQDGKWYDYKGDEINTSVFRITHWKPIKI